MDKHQVRNGEYNVNIVLHTFCVIDRFR